MTDKKMKLEDMTKEQLIEQCKKRECCGNCEGSIMNWPNNYECENLNSAFYGEEMAPEGCCSAWELWNDIKEKENE